ncbi:MAG: peptide transporter ATP-binding protein [Solirubrobacterales bacterium]|nr:peptide transporter ATP-binding protein [Solirubrobacterales bacterium]
MSVLTVEDLHVRYPGDGTGDVHAVKGVSFAVAPGRTLAIVGESGCGKSSVANAVARLIRPASGRIEFLGRDLEPMRGRALRDGRRGIQMVFQDPLDALDPRMTVRSSVEEPLRLPGLVRAERAARVREALEAVDLGEQFLDRYPHQLSGGQQQRVVIARALAPRPKLIVLDEPTASLDFLVRERIVDLLAGIQEQTGCAFVFISHDIGTVRKIADDVAVMYLGRIVEMGPAREILRAPVHPYTTALLDAVPVPDPSLRGRRGDLAADPGDLSEPGSGCAFAPRCPLADEVCETRPPLTFRDGRDVACHHAVGPHVSNTTPMEAAR